RSSSDLIGSNTITMEMVEVLNHFKAQLSNECPKKVGMMAKAINQPQMSIEYRKHASPLIRLYKSKVMELIPYTKNVYIISDNLLRNCCPNKKYPVTVTAPSNARISPNNAKPLT